MRHQFIQKMMFSFGVSGVDSVKLFIKVVGQRFTAAHVKALLLALLDRIEIEKDYTLASQRFDIAESLGLTVEFGEQVSGRMN